MLLSLCLILPYRLNAHVQQLSLAWSFNKESAPIAPKSQGSKQITFSSVLAHYLLSSLHYALPLPK